VAHRHLFFDAKRLIWLTAFEGMAESAERMRSALSLLTERIFTVWAEVQIEFIRKVYITPKGKCHL
jgi:hypothetical protein